MGWLLLNFLPIKVRFWKLHTRRWLKHSFCFFVIKPIDAPNSQICFVMKRYMFRTVRMSIIRSLFTVLSAMLYVIQVCRQLSRRSICFYSTAVYKPVWHIPLLSVQWINSWWWTDELSETCRVSWQNKFVKLVHLVGFIIRKWTICWS